jgi:hypothetical protein
MGDVCTRGVSRIRSSALKFQAQRSLSPHLAIFCPRALSRCSVDLEIVAQPPPPAILDPGPGARCRLIPGLEACHRSPLPQAIRVLVLVIVASPPSTLTLPPLERAAAALFLKP